MKASILTEAGKDIGFGHLTRCIALYQAIEEKNGIPELIINGDESILDFVKDKKHQTFNWVADSEKLMKLVKDSDSVIIDSYLAPKSLYDNISNLLYSRPKPKSQPLLMIDDYNRINYPKGIVTNPSIYGDKLDYPQEKGKEYLSGKDYVILRKEFWDISEKKIDKEVKDVLITFGGINSNDFLKKLLKFLSEKFPNFNYHVVTNIKLNLNLNLNLYVNLSASRMLDLMLKADVCISGGGQTTYELARVGVPTIGICFAENQKMNLEGWQNQGFIDYIGWHNDGNLLRKVKDSMERLKPYDERIRRSRAGRDYINGKGVFRIINRFYKF
jgi:UDP-2,4-diacetamido-2,4,6-trideoxy-beta-L-altropyranose hydrolase